MIHYILTSEETVPSVKLTMEQNHLTHEVYLRAKNVSSGIAYIVLSLTERGTIKLCKGIPREFGFKVNPDGQIVIEN
jgi:hypothetical protein